MYKFRPSHKIPKLSRHPVHKRVINYTGHSQSLSQQHPRINDNNNKYIYFRIIDRPINLGTLMYHHRLQCSAVMAKTITLAF